MALVPVTADTGHLGLLGVLMHPNAVAALALLTAFADQVAGMLADALPATDCPRSHRAPGLPLQRQLLDAINHAIVATEPDGTVVVWNRSAEQIYSWPGECATFVRRLSRRQCGW
ncbi:MAG: hypothetical protein HGA45_19460 [Chloroflexales bacterium]|nr:hypothetical protein [Chloroflexales bacterium]